MIMKSSKIFFTLSLLILSSIGVWGQCTITVKFENVKQRSGEIRVAICVSPKEFMTKIYREEVIKVPAKGDIIAQFKNVPKGTYAIRSYQDINISNELDTNFLGIPEEPFGFSNNPTVLMGPPSFEDASFIVNKDTMVKLALQLIEIF
jgi:uncharacterized protein (DUF2141 family)